MRPRAVTVALTRLATGVVMLAAVVAPAVAAANATAPPQPSLRKMPPAWLGYGVMFALVAVVIAISLMPSKRSHQD